MSTVFYDEPPSSSGLPPLAVGTIVALREFGTVAIVIPDPRPPSRVSRDRVRVRVLQPAPGSSWEAGTEVPMARGACCPALPLLWEARRALAERG